MDKFQDLASKVLENLDHLHRDRDCYFHLQLMHHHHQHPWFPQLIHSNRFLLGSLEVVILEESFLFLQEFLHIHHHLHPIHQIDRSYQNLVLWIHHHPLPERL
jgi:hypothetical protein